MVAREAFPEDIIIAALHLVGGDVRMADDERLAKVFDVAARQDEALAVFRMHPQYGHSRVLSEGLQTLDLGGAIVRDNAPLEYFRVSGRVVGGYGASKFEGLSPELRERVKELAASIKTTFQAS